MTTNYIPQPSLFDPLALDAISSEQPEPPEPAQKQQANDDPFGVLKEFKTLKTPAPANYEQMIRDEATRQGVDPEFMLRIYRQEGSEGNPRARSPKGALGLLQIMPGTGRKWGASVNQLYDPATNIRIGVSEARERLKQNGSKALGAAGYNAGQGAVERYGGVPPYPETRAYVANTNNATQDDPFGVLAEFQKGVPAMAPAPGQPVANTTPQQPAAPLQLGKLTPDVNISAGSEVGQGTVPRSVYQKIGGSSLVDLNEDLAALDAHQITPEQFKQRAQDKFAAAIGFREPSQVEVARQWGEAHHAGYDPFALDATPDQIATVARRQKGLLPISISPQNSKVLEGILNDRLLNPSLAQAEAATRRAPRQVSGLEKVVRAAPGVGEAMAAADKLGLSSDIQSAATQVGADALQTAYNLWKLSGGEKPVESELSRRLLEQAQAEAEQSPGAIHEIARGLLQGLFATPEYLLAAEAGPLGFAALGGAERAHRGVGQATKAALINAIIGAALHGGAELPTGVRVPYSAGVGAVPPALEAATQGATPGQAALAAVPGAVQMGVLGVAGGKGKGEEPWTGPAVTPEVLQRAQELTASRVLAAIGAKTLTTKADVEAIRQSALADALTEARGGQHATQTGQEQTGNEAELRGVRAGTNVPAHEGEVRQGESEQAAGRGGTERGTEVQPKEVLAEAAGRGKVSAEDEEMLKQKSMRGERLTPAEEAMAARVQQEFEARRALPAEEAAKLSEREWQDWVGSRVPSEVFGDAAVATADEAHRATVMRGDLVGAEMIRKRINFLATEEKDGTPLPRNVKSNERTERVIADMKARERAVVGPSLQEYTDQAIENLKRTSRTIKPIKGEGTSAAAQPGKEALFENIPPEEAAKRAEQNTRNATEFSYENRDRQFTSPQDILDFADDIARINNQGILKEGIGTPVVRALDSDRYPYTSVADLPKAREQFAKELLDRLNDPNADPRETAAWIEWRGNYTDHFWSDASGRTSRALADWVLMRKGEKLPEAVPMPKVAVDARRTGESGESYLSPDWEKFRDVYMKGFGEAPKTAKAAVPPTTPVSRQTVINKTLSGESLTPEEKAVTDYIGRQYANQQQPVSELLRPGAAAGAEKEGATQGQIPEAAGKAKATVAQAKVGTESWRDSLAQGAAAARERINARRRGKGGEAGFLGFGKKGVKPEPPPREASAVSEPYEREYRPEMLDIIRRLREGGVQSYESLRTDVYTVLGDARTRLQDALRESKSPNTSEILHYTQDYADHVLLEDPKVAESMREALGNKAYLVDEFIQAQRIEKAMTYVLFEDMPAQKVWLDESTGQKRIGEPESVVQPLPSGEAFGPLSDQLRRGLTDEERHRRVVENLHASDAARQSLQEAMTKAGFKPSEVEQVGRLGEPQLRKLEYQIRSKLPKAEISKLNDYLLLRRRAAALDAAVGERVATSALQSDRRYSDSRSEAGFAALLGGGREVGPEGMAGSLEDFYDYMLVGMEKLVETGSDFKTWSGEMVREFGYWIRPHLSTLYTAASGRLASVQHGDVTPEGYPVRAATLSGVKRSMVQGLHNALIKNIRAHTGEPELLHRERQLVRDVLAKPQFYIDEYRMKFNDNIIDSDRVKTIFGLYRSDPARWAEATHEASSFIAKLDFQQRLQQLTNKGVESPHIEFRAGGPGSGKTSTIQVLGKKRRGVPSADLVYDSLFSSVEGNRAAINAVFDARPNATIEINYVHRPVRLAAKGVLERAVPNEEGTHRRPTPVERTGRGHYNAQNALLETYEEFKDDPRITFNVTDNSGELHEIKPADVELLRQNRYNSVNEAINEAKRGTEERYNQGDIPAEVYQAATGQRPPSTVEGTVAKVAGVGDQNAPRERAESSGAPRAVADESLAEVPAEVTHFTYAAPEQVFPGGFSNVSAERRMRGGISAPEGSLWTTADEGRGARRYGPEEIRLRPPTDARILDLTKPNQFSALPNAKVGQAIKDARYDGYLHVDLATGDRAIAWFYPERFKVVNTPTEGAVFHPGTATTVPPRTIAEARKSPKYSEYNRIISEIANANEVSIRRLDQQPGVIRPSLGWWGETPDSISLDTTMRSVLVGDPRAIEYTIAKAAQAADQHAAIFWRQNPDGPDTVLEVQIPSLSDTQTEALINTLQKHGIQGGTLSANRLTIADIGSKQQSNLVDAILDFEEATGKKAYIATARKVDVTLLDREAYEKIIKDYEGAKTPGAGVTNQRGSQEALPAPSGVPPTGPHNIEPTALAAINARKLVEETEPIKLDAEGQRAFYNTTRGVTHEVQTWYAGEGEGGKKRTPVDLANRIVDTLGPQINTILDKVRDREAVKLRPALKLYDAGPENPNVWLLVWRPEEGARFEAEGTPVHGHGSSHVGVRVVKGTVTERLYLGTKSGVAPESGEHTTATSHPLTEGSSYSLGAPYIHDFVNEGKEFAATLHVYDPALYKMEMYRVEPDGRIVMTDTWEEGKGMRHPEEMPIEKGAAASAASTKTTEISKPRNRAEFESALREHFAYSDQTASATGSVVDAMADTYAKNSGRPKEEFYAQIGVTKGGEVAGGLEQRDLNRGLLSSPAAKKFLEGTKIVDGKGNPLILYHQTREGNVSLIEKEGFNVTKVGARGTDETMPDGIFMKTTERALPLSDRPDLERQIPLVASIRNPLRVKTRAELTNWATKNSPEYARQINERRTFIDDAAAEMHEMVRANPFDSDGKIANFHDKTMEEFIKISGEARKTLTKLLRDKGYDGVIMAHDQGGATWTKAIVALDPTQVKSATKNVGTFDPTKPSILLQEAFDAQGNPLQGEVRALTEFRDSGQAIIHALNNPNESTAVHEIHHAAVPLFMRLASEQPNTQLARDMDSMARYMGMENAANFVTQHERYVGGQLEGGDLTRYVEGQEKAARGFEEYLRTGKAPTPELTSVFARFKEWLGNIYKSAVGQVTDEQRAVWDRLLGAGKLAETAPETIPPVESVAAVEARLFRHGQFGDVTLVRKNGDGTLTVKDAEGKLHRIQNPTGPGGNRQAAIIPRKPPESQLKERSLPKTLEAHGLESGDNPYYWSETLAHGVETGRENVASKGIRGSIEYVMHSEPGIDWAPTAYATMDALRNAETKARQKGQFETADALLNQRTNFVGDFAERATKLGQSIAGIRAIEEFAPDRALSQIERMSQRKLHHGLKPTDVTRIEKKATELKVANDIARQAAQTVSQNYGEFQGKQPAPEESPRTYQQQLDEQSRNALTALKKKATFDFGHLERPSERGAITINEPPLPGDAELLAQYAAGRLRKVKSVADLNKEITDLAPDAEPFLSAIRRRAYAIREEARTNEIGTATIERTKTVVQEIQAEVAQAVRDRNEAERALRAKAHENRQEFISEARTQAADYRAQTKAELEAIADEARERVRSVQAEYKAALQAQRAEFRASLKAQRAAEKQAKLWDTPLRNEAAAARERLKTATDPASPDTIRDLVSIASELMLPDKPGGPVRRGRGGPLGFYRNLHQTYPDLITRKNESEIFKRAYERVQDITTASREAARLASAARESRAYWENAGVDIDQQAILIRRAEAYRRQVEARTAMMGEFARVTRPLWSRVLSEVQSIPRSLMSSVDAPLGRQGLFFTITHPIESSRATLPATWRGYTAWTPEQFDQAVRELQQHPDYDLFRRAGGDWTVASTSTYMGDTGISSGEIGTRLAAEEPFQSSIATKLFPHVRLSDQGFNLPMNAQRLTLFSRYADIGRLEGYTWENNPEFFKQAAGFVNIATGRGSLSAKAQAFSSNLNWLFFSTRLNYSRGQLLSRLLLTPIGVMKADPVMRKIIAGEAVRLAAGMGVIYLTARAAGLNPTFDPHDPDFMKLRVGNTRYDPTGGEGGLIRFIVRLVQSAGNDEGAPSSEKWDNILKTYLRQKLAPWPGAAINIRANTAIGKLAQGDVEGARQVFGSGKTVVGTEANLKFLPPTSIRNIHEMTEHNEAIKMMIPMIIGDLMDNLAEEGWKGAIKTSPGLAGVSVQTYKSTPENERAKRIRDLAKQRQAAIDALRKNPNDTKILDKLAEEGKMTEEGRDRVIKAASRAPIENKFLGRPGIEDKLIFYRHATPEEQKRLQPLLQRAWASAVGEPVLNEKTGKYEQRKAILPPADIDRLREEFAPELGLKSEKAPVSH